MLFIKFLESLQFNYNTLADRLKTGGITFVCFKNNIALKLLSGPDTTTVDSITKNRRTDFKVLVIISEFIHVFVLWSLTFFQQDDVVIHSL